MGLRKAACKGLCLGRELGRLTSPMNQAENPHQRLREGPRSVCILPEVLFVALHFLIQSLGCFLLWAGIRISADSPQEKKISWHLPGLNSRKGRECPEALVRFPTVTFSSEIRHLHDSL